MEGPLNWRAHRRRNFQWLIIVFSDAVKPLIKVSNQLVAAPANSDVVLHCYVESWPKALNTWYRDDGEHNNIARAISQCLSHSDHDRFYVPTELYNDLAINFVTKRFNFVQNLWHRREEFCHFERIYRYMNNVFVLCNHRSTGCERIATPHIIDLFL